MYYIRFSLFVQDGKIDIWKFVNVVNVFVIILCKKNPANVMSFENLPIFRTYRIYLHP